MCKALISGPPERGACAAVEAPPVLSLALLAPSLVGRACSARPARRAAAAVAMAEQLRKIQHDAYYGVYKAAAITDLQLTFMARGALPDAPQHAWPARG